MTVQSNSDLSIMELSGNHRDCSIHIESACQLHGAKMTRHGLLHKRLTSADKANSYIKNFVALIKKQPNIGYADVNLVF